MALIVVAGADVSVGGSWQPDGMPRHGALTEVEKRILALEQGFYRYAGVKDQQIFEAVRMSPTRYYQVLNELIDTDEAMRWDPMTCKRLQRLREARRAQRSGQRLRSV